MVEDTTPKVRIRRIGKENRPIILLWEHVQLETVGSSPFSAYREAGCADYLEGTCRGSSQG